MHLRRFWLPLELPIPRVVLDSFSAISLAFEHQSEARITIQVLLGKIRRAEGITIGRFPLGIHILRIRASCTNIDSSIFYCNYETVRYSGDYFLGLFWNCFFSSFDAVFTNLFLGTLGSKPHLCNNL